MMTMLAAVGEQPLDERGPGRASALDLLEVYGDQSRRSPAVISTVATRSLRDDSTPGRLGQQVSRAGPARSARAAEAIAPAGEPG
jgi:hypothetical protein